MPRQTQLSVVPDFPMSGVNTVLYYQVPNWAAIKAIRAKLTGADWMVWAYLQMLDPHGDRLKQIPNYREISEIIGLCKKQVRRSMDKLEKMGFWEVEVVTMKGRNLAVPARKNKVETRTNKSLKLLPDNTSEPAWTKLSHLGQSCPTKDKVVPKVSNSEGQSCLGEGQSCLGEGQSCLGEGQSCLNQSPKPLSSKTSEFPQTIQTIQTSSECILTRTRTRTGTHTHAHTRKNPKPDLTNPELTTPNQDISQLSGENENLDEDKFSAAAPPPALLPEKTPPDTPNPKNYQLPSKITEAVLHPQKMNSEGRNIRPQIRRPKFLYPDGEWLDSQGRMNVDFIRWMSSRWKVKFPDNAERPTEEIMADVLAYFANQPEKVAIQWDAYCAIASRKVENITQRALTGFTMSSVDSREYAIAASAIPTSQADAATDFTPQSVCDRSAEVQRVLESSGQSAQVLQIAPGQKTLVGERLTAVVGEPCQTVPAPIPDPWQVVGEPCRTEEQEGNWSEIVTAKRQEWENSRPPKAVNFSDAISGIPAQPTPFTREGFVIVGKQIEPDSNHGVYKIQFDYQTPVQEIKTPPQDIADITPEQQAINCQKIAEIIKSLTDKKSGKFAGKNWAEKLSTEAKNKPQYQVNKDGYFIDEEGEW